MKYLNEIWLVDNVFPLCYNTQGGMQCLKRNENTKGNTMRSRCSDDKDLVRTQVWEC